MMSTTPSPVQNDLAYSAGERHAVVTAFVEDQLGAGAAGRLNTNIHAVDEMLAFTPPPRAQQLLHYFGTGLQMLRAIRHIARWRFGSLSDVRSLLDFACGYGRLGRWLDLDLPATRIWSSDIYAGGVEFQQKQFGHNGIVSVPVPTDFTCRQRFDFIFVASLFSHLPEPTFLGWLRRLYELLDEDGVLVFSVHDEPGAPPGMAVPRSGILFLAQSESGSLDKQQYGSSWVTEAFVARSIAKATNSSSYIRIPRGLCHHQDLYVVTKGRTSDPATLVFDHGPQGAVDVATLQSPHDLLVEGWAADITRGCDIVDVQVMVDGRLVQRCRPFKARPDVASVLRDPSHLFSGWAMHARLQEPLTAGSTVLVKAINSCGTPQVLGILETTGVSMTRFPAQLFRWSG